MPRQRRFRPAHRAPAATGLRLAAGAKVEPKNTERARAPPRRQGQRTARAVASRRRSSCAPTSGSSSCLATQKFGPPTAATGQKPPPPQSFVCLLLPGADIAAGPAILAGDLAWRTALAPPVCSIAFGYLSLKGLACLLRFAFLAFALPGGIVGNDAFAFLSLSGIAGRDLVGSNGGAGYPRHAGRQLQPPARAVRWPRRTAVPGG